MFDFLGIKKQISSLSSQMENINSQIKRKQTDLEYLRTAPPQKSDIEKYLLDTVIPQLGAAYDQSLEFLVTRLIHDPLHVEKVDGVGVLAVQPGAGVPAGLKSFEAAIAALLGDTIKAGLRKKLSAMDWPEAGPPIAERPSLISKLETELAALRREQVELARAAADVGIILPGGVTYE